MIALLISGSIVAGMLLGWFGHKTFLRIQAWGENMNTQDRIFRGTLPRSSMEFQSSRKRPVADPGPVPPLSSRLPLGAVSLK